MSIIDKICVLLERQGKTQKDLCDFLGISNNRFTDWKSGRLKSYQKLLPQIAEFLGVSVEDLLYKDVTIEPQRTISENKEKTYIIAFLDMLGIKKEVKSENSNIIQKMNAVYEVIQKTIKNFNDKTKNKAYSKIKTKIFSDNIAFVLETKDSYPDRMLNLQILVAVLIQIQKVILINFEILIRGAICFGELYFDETFLCGKALVNAYNLESNIAIYPRILLDKSLAKEYISFENENPDYLDLFNLCQDSDGSFFLNFLNAATIDDIKKLKCVIERTLAKAIESKDEKIIQKNEWLALFFNENANVKFNGLDIVVEIQKINESKADKELENLLNGRTEEEKEEIIKLIKDNDTNTEADTSGTA